MHGRRHHTMLKSHFIAGSNWPEETQIPELRTMARTIRDKLDGIVSFWMF